MAVASAAYPVALSDQLRSLVKGRGWQPWIKHGASHFDPLNVPLIRLDHPAPITDADVPDADVVIATWWETAEWVARLAPEKGAKAYFIQHHETFDYLPVERVKATYRLPLFKITTAPWIVDLMETAYGDRQVALIPNSVDLKQFFAPPRNKQPVPTIGMLYSHTYWKGCDISLKAFSIAAEQVPALRLVTFGYYRESPDLPLPKNSDFHFEPAQAELRNIYAVCDAWLFTSRQEGFGLPILEAMACRTPVIGTPAGAAPELLANGAGILVNPEDPESMAEAIVKIAHLSNQEWQQLSEAAYTRVTGYTWENATDQFEGVLNKIGRC